MSRKESLTVIQAGERIEKMLLVNQLQELRLATFVDEYETLAQDAARAHWSHEKYLATLTKHETERRAANRRQRRIKEARFPFSKDLVDFDFCCHSQPQPATGLSLSTRTLPPRCITHHHGRCTRFGQNPHRYLSWPKCLS